MGFKVDEKRIISLTVSGPHTYWAKMQISYYREQLASLVKVHPLLLTYGRLSLFSPSPLIPLIVLTRCRYGIPYSLPAPPRWTSNLSVSVRDWGLLRGGRVPYTSSAGGDDVSLKQLVFWHKEFPGFSSSAWSNISTWWKEASPKKSPLLPLTPLWHKVRESPSW